MVSTERSDVGEDSVEGTELSEGSVIAERYRIEGKLGTGGIGVVYRAVQAPLDRPVAIKVLHDDLLVLDELRQRFEREARVLSKLIHPHVVSISDYGIDGHRPFLVMELLEGRTLEELVREDPMDPARALHIARQLLSGLAFAHERGIAHRDLKPANVFLTQMSDGSEHVRLLDFGLARVVSTEDTGEDVALTQRGVIFGTPAYMSPEQAAGSPADERSDVYSAGALIFEMLAGRRPYLGDTRAELLRAHLTAPVPRIGTVRRDLACEPALVRLIDVAMAKEPADRYQTAGEMLAAFDALADPAARLAPDDDLSLVSTHVSGVAAARTTGRTSLRLFAGGGALVGLALLGGGLFWSFGPTQGDAPPAAPRPAPEAPALPPDPFAEPPPEPLRPFLVLVEQQHVFEDLAEVRPLMALGRAMPDDPRPILLVGHLFVLKGWFTEGLRRYEMALERDPLARGDPRMLHGLVAMASRDSVGEDAAEMLVSVYGEEALPAIEQAVLDTEGDALAQLRMVRLRERIQSPPEPDQL